MTEINPGLIIILGAFAVPLLNGILRKAYMLMLPVASLVYMLGFDHGIYGQVEFMGFTLETFRLDNLSFIFGLVFHIAAFLGVLYALHVKDTGQHLAALIRPALARGEWVLCDRFMDATWAYQGAGRGLDRERIAAMERLVLQGLTPDRTLLFDVPVAEGLARAGKRSRPDRIEREQAAFFERVRQCYLERATGEPDRFRVVDAGVGLDQVRAQLENHLQEMLQWR